MVMQLTREEIVVNGVNEYEILIIVCAAMEKWNYGTKLKYVSQQHGV